MSRRHGMGSYMIGQRTPCPQLSGVSEIFGLDTCQRYHPSPCFLRDAGLLGTMIGVLQRGARPHLEGAVDPIGYTLAGRVKASRNLRDRLAGVIACEDLRPLDLAERSGRHPAQAFEPVQFVGG